MAGICSDCDRLAKLRGLCTACYQRRRYQGTLPDATPPSVLCEECGVEFVGKNRGARFHSRACAEKARYHKRVDGLRPTDLRCEQCGSDFEYQGHYQRFCTRKCAQDWSNQQRAHAVKAQKIVDRLPCLGCKNPISEDRGGKALYCSEECKLSSRRHQTYGLSKVDLEQLLAQHEVCAICESPNWGGPHGKPNVDHDHATGAVRGILCNKCNLGLGRFNDDPAILRAAVAYLEKYQT